MSLANNENMHETMPLPDSSRIMGLFPAGLVLCTMPLLVGLSSGAASGRLQPQTGFGPEDKGGTYLRRRVDNSFPARNNQEAGQCNHKLWLGAWYISSIVLHYYSRVSNCFSLHPHPTSRAAFRRARRTAMRKKG